MGRSCCGSLAPMRSFERSRCWCFQPIRPVGGCATCSRSAQRAILANHSRQKSCGRNCRRWRERFMLDTITGSVLLDSASKILETMFFATVLGEADGPSGNREEMIGASVAFDGRIGGFLAIATDTETAKTLAADFLALESRDMVDS